MNLKRWKNPEVPISMLALKLCEEAGEVANEITDGWQTGTGKVSRKRAVEEVDHVIAIAEILKARLLADRKL